MTEQQTLPTDVQEMRQSATFVYRELQHAGGSLRITDLIGRTGLSRPTIRRAVTDLEDNEFVESTYGGGDARERVVHIVE